MNRWVALIIAIIGGGAVAFAIIVALVPALYGFLWIFVFGDDPWPNWFERASNVAIPLLGLAIWAIAAWIIWKLLAVRRRAG